MKATGIVRRIDDLGRIVITKEIRRTLKIKEGDLMEMFVHDGGVFLKKYSPLSTLIEFAQEFADILFKVTGHVALISDRDVIIAVSGAPKRDFLAKPVWNEGLNAMEQRKTRTNTSTEEAFSYCTQVVTPIITEGDVVGAVGLVAQDVGIGIVAQRLVETVALFLAKQMEG